jgi:hypothetical protein
MAYWLFQGNPKYYRIQDAIRDFDEMPWLTTRYAKEIALGDGVIVWIAGKEAGAYAIAEIGGLPELMPNPSDRAYWIDKSRIGTRPQAMLRFTQKLTTPILRTTVRQDPILKDLTIIRAPNSTNFRLTPAHWQRFHTLITESTD